MKIKQTISDIFKTMSFTFGLIFKDSALFTILYALFKIITALLPSVMILLTKEITDGLIAVYNGDEPAKLWLFIIALFVFTILISVLDDMGMALYHFMRDKNEKYLNTLVLGKLSRIKTSRLEDDKSKDAIQATMQTDFNISGTFGYIFDLGAPLITVISTVAVIFAYYPLIALFYLLTTIPTIIIHTIQSNKMSRWSIDSIPENRRKDYYYGMLTQKHHAKDLRLYNLAEPIKKKYSDLWVKINSAREKIFTQGFRSKSGAILIQCAGYVGMYVYLIYKTYTGDLSIGGLTAFTGGIMTISHSFNSFVWSLRTYIDIFVKRTLMIIDFFDWEEETDIGTEQQTLDKFDIEFKNVTFKYPNTENIILKNLSFSIKDGEKIAVIGENGAGKSTIIKLLLRLYEPDSGEILINGVNVNTYEISSYRKKFSACFQSVNDYRLTFAENIALSNLDELSDTDKIIAASNAAGLNNIQDEWENKLDTNMTRQFYEDGVELSGGQWQKVAIARAFFRNASFIILDEPSAALDPKAESQIFNSFAELCGNRSGLLISHRLSNIMLVNKIIFIKQGEVTESGTHSELMANNQTYAQMYNLQAEKYRIELESEAAV